MEKQAGFSQKKMEASDSCYFDSSEPLSLNSTRVEFDSSQPLLSLNSMRSQFDSAVEPLSLEPLSLNSARHEFDSVEPLSLEYEYEIEGLGRPQQQEHCSR